MNPAAFAFYVAVPGAFLVVAVVTLAVRVRRRLRSPAKSLPPGAR